MLFSVRKQTSKRKHQMNSKWPWLPDPCRCDFATIAAAAVVVVVVVVAAAAAAATTTTTTTATTTKLNRASMTACLPP